MTQTLRPYQTAAVSAIIDAFLEDYKRVLYTMATGCGKTTTFAELTKIFHEFHDFKVLILAHRFELVSQAFYRIKDHCGFDAYQIGMEQAEIKAPRSAVCVCGSVFTVVSEKRLPDFTPSAIIIDEAHRAAADTYQKIMKRWPDALIVGCTATAKRTDKKSLYAELPDGSPAYLFDKKTKKRVLADKEKSVFEKLVSEFTVLDAIEGGYLVPIKGHSVKTATDLSDVETDTDGDFKDGQLQKAVDNAERTICAINAWKDIAVDRPTLVFCSGVEHAEHAAELWRQAGYTAAALNGETDKTERAQTLARFKSGQVQVLCNMGLFTEGTDLPTCSCVVHLRPTKSWNLYVQMTGRGSRTLPGVIDSIEAAEGRVAAIEASGKPDCIVLDLVDICAGNDLCSVPSILDLPVNLDLEGESVTDAQKMLMEFEEVREQVIGECPVTFRELKARLEQVQLIRNSAAKTRDTWATTDRGTFSLRKLLPVGYQAELAPIEAGNYRLTIKRGVEEIYNRVGFPREDFAEYLDRAAETACKAIDKHKALQPVASRGTLGRLSVKQTAVLTRRGHSRNDIDAMPYKKAKALIDGYMREWQARQEASGVDEVAF